MSKTRPARSSGYATLIVFAILIAYLAWSQLRGTREAADRTLSLDHPIAAAFAARQSNVPVQGHGTVTRVLADDLDGSRHQRFILRVESGHTVLVAHNIDLAPRIADLRTGDTVEFQGEYEWNESGGVIHWTHHDPAGQHPAGWLRHNGERYE